MNASLFLAGLGNIGSQLVPLLASLPEVQRVGLVDFDRYTAGNLGGQRIATRDLGQYKARVQRRVLRSIRPDLTVVAHPCRFEDLPMGLLRGSTILCCCDSRAARQAVNRTARALGCAWIDAALSREGNVRSRAYLPGPEHDCLECSWGPGDYELLEQRLPCQGLASAAAPTDAPIELGAIAAGIQLALLRRLGAGPEAVDAIAGQQWFYDLPSGRGWTGRYSANPACRLDHAPWHITGLERGSVRAPLADALALAGPPSADNTLAVPGRVFVRRLRCPACGSAWRIQCRLSGRVATTVCPGCRVPLLASALDADELLQAGTVSAAVLREPLSRRGLVAGDVIEVCAGRAIRHFQLA